jgi:hypothetical protein
MSIRGGNPTVEAPVIPEGGYIGNGFRSIGCVIQQQGGCMASPNATGRASFAPPLSEQVAKCNRLLHIEEALEKGIVSRRTVPVRHLYLKGVPTS